MFLTQEQVKTETQKAFEELKRQLPDFVRTASSFGLYFAVDKEGLDLIKVVVDNRYSSYGFGCGSRVVGLQMRVDGPSNLKAKVFPQLKDGSFNWDKIKQDVKLRLELLESQNKINETKDKFITQNEPIVKRLERQAAKVDDLNLIYQFSIVPSASEKGVVSVVCRINRDMSEAKAKALMDALQVVDGVE